jgi:hypothetical protein
MDGPPQAGQYRVIYADPPWQFATYSDKGKGRSAEAHYDCLSLEDIKAFPVAAWAAPHTVGNQGVSLIPYARKRSGAPSTRAK